MENKKRFSKSELKAIKDDFYQQLSSLSVNSESRIDSLTQKGADNYSDPHDRAAMETDRDLDLRISERQRKLVTKIKKIISRIENGAYQVCSSCGDFIPKSRLQARPITDLCIKCKESEEQGERLA